MKEWKIEWIIRIKMWRLYYCMMIVDEEWWEDWVGGCGWVISVRVLTVGVLLKRKTGVVSWYWCKDDVSDGDWLWWWWKIVWWSMMELLEIGNGVMWCYDIRAGDCYGWMKEKGRGLEWMGWGCVGYLFKYHIWFHCLLLLFLLSLLQLLSCRYFLLVLIRWSMWRGKVW